MPRVECGDGLLRAAAVRHHGAGTWSIAIVNRSGDELPVSIAWHGAGAPEGAAFRKYVYDPRAVPQHPFGDLQAPAGTVAMKDGRLVDQLAAGTLSIYTTAFDDRPPAPVRGLRVERAPAGHTRLTWLPNAEPDLCYYRIYRSAQASFAPQAGMQIGSTVATEFTDDSGPAGAKRSYAVLAVDQSGNASRP